MRRKLGQLFQDISELNPPTVLAGFIFSSIEKEKAKKAKRQMVFSYLGFVGSFVLAIYVGTNFGQTFLQSEFWTIFSLIFSDLFVVIGNWNSFGYSLLETFPVMHVTALLLPVFTLLISAKFYFANKFNLIHKYRVHKIYG